MIRKHFRLKRLALGLAFAAVAAPAAQATPYGGAPTSDVTAGITAREADSYLTTEVSAYELGSGSVRVLPGGMTLSSSSAVRSENSFGAPGPSAAGATGPTGVELARATPTNGFDWSDAGIGASITFALSLMLMTVLLLGRRYRSRIDRTLASA
jgi:hypothetical protein